MISFCFIAVFYLLSYRTNRDFHTLQNHARVHFAPQHEGTVHSSVDTALSVPSYRHEQTQHEWNRLHGNVHDYSSNMFAIPVDALSVYDSIRSLHQSTTRDHFFLSKESSSVFSDTSGFSHEKYYATIQTLALNNSYYILGRGSCGMHIRKVSQNGVETVNDCEIPFSDSEGWDKKEYYSTISAVVANGHIYVVGRGSCGMHIWKLVGEKAVNISSCEIPFSDSSGWSDEKHYSTIQVAEANENVYIIGRGSCGMHIYQTWDDEVYEVDKCGIAMSDDNGWAERKYYSTIRTAVVYNEVHIIGRGACGMIIWKVLSEKRVEHVNSCSIPFSDAEGWGEPEFYTTIYAVADDTGIFITGRGECGMHIYKLIDSTTNAVNLCGIQFGDRFGWKRFTYYSSIGAVVANNDLYIYGRGTCGMLVYKLYDGKHAEAVGLCEILLGDRKGWSKLEHFSTVQGIAGKGLVISARGSCGMFIFEQQDTSVHTVGKCI